MGLGRRQYGRLFLAIAGLLVMSVCSTYIIFMAQNI